LLGKAPRANLFQYPVRSAAGFFIERLSGNTESHGDDNMILMAKSIDRFVSTALVSLFVLIESQVSHAQITSDGTVSTEAISIDGSNFEINGGRQIGGNLFHSFDEFSVITGGSATFNNSLSVQNIISRITGGTISNIDGLISAKGNANFFLINSNGIILGSNARLDVGGSAIFTTADSLNFADGSFFGATNTKAKAQPLLTVSIPNGLQFGSNSGQIAIHKSEALQVRPGKTLAFIGGDVLIDGALLSAPGGRIEIGSVASNSFVGLTPIFKGWNLNYQAVRDFQDIKLSETIIDGENADGIQLQGRQIVITNGSLVNTLNLGADPGGDIIVRASKFIEISDFSALSTTSGLDGATGSAGDITLETQQLMVSSGSTIRATTEGIGRGGNINVNATESIEVDGRGENTPLTAETFGNGNAGDINITTKKLFLRDGGLISASARTPIEGTAVSGNAGRINVTASDLVEVSGQGASENQSVPSGFFARVRGSTTTGKGGSIQISTGRLSIQNGGTISVSADRGSTGQAGSLDINASTVEVSGSDSTILADSVSPKPAGDVTINTDRLLIKNGASVSVNSQGSGAAGNLFVSARSVELNDRARITATSNSGNGGNIIFKIGNTLLLRNNSRISTTAGIAQGSGNGGNISIDSLFIIANPFENSDIEANAFSGRGGNVQINTKGIFGIKPRIRLTPLSDITASSDFGISGTVTLNTPDADPSRGTTTLPTGLVDTNALIANSCIARTSRQGRFTITGTGGVAAQPDDLANSSFPTYELVPDTARSQTTAPSSTLRSDEAIAEPDGVYRLANGEVVLGRSCR
jgi:filamentous hemagglutinin family protein